MKFIPFLLFISASIFAQNSAKQQVVEAKIEKVTVFLNGAEVTRIGKVSMAAGRTELVFRGISPQIDKQSIQVKSEGRFTVLSVVNQMGNQLEKEKQVEITKLDAQKELIEDKIKTEKTNLTVFKREEEMLVKNQNVGGVSTGLKIEEFKLAVEYQRSRMQEVLTKQLEIERNIKKLESEIKKINQQLTDLTVVQSSNSSEIIVTVSAKELVNGALTISYFVENAGWTPTYDLRVEDISKPINLAYKANVYQFSGENWKEVKLTVSTANPKQKGTPPLLNNWIWGIPNNYSNYYNSIDNQVKNLTEITGKVRFSGDLSSVPGASVQIRGTNFGTTTDANGFYRINIPPNLSKTGIVLIISSVGFMKQEVTVNNRSEIDVNLAEDVKALEEVAVVGYGVQRKSEMDGILQGRAAGVDVRMRGNSTISKSASVPLEITEKDAPTSQQFEIKMPYNIPSDGKVYTVEIKEEEIPAIYEYYCVPKIDRDAFLTAKVIDWEKYKLLEGETNLYLEGTYLGKSSLNLSNKDTLSVSLGRDKNIIVNRIRVKASQKKQFIGSSKIDTRSYEIIIRNTKKQAINLVIDDQFPLSFNKEVEVNDKEAPEASTNNDTGKITWKFNLEPTNEKKLNMKYTVKSPKVGYLEVE
jgi:Domain of unknown function (DUF4139)/N-terminal domain of unknown function (DUF4140)